MDYFRYITTIKNLKVESVKDGYADVFKAIKEDVLNNIDDKEYTEAKQMVYQGLIQEFELKYLHEQIKKQIEDGFYNIQDFRTEYVEIVVDDIYHSYGYIKQTEDVKTRKSLLKKELNKKYNAKPSWLP